VTNEIKVQCETKLYLPIENLNEFQGELKTLSTVNFEKLKKQIIDQGFSSPFLVWKNDGIYFLLDGHQRKRVVTKLKEAGYKVPDLPCVEIFAKTKLEAKKKLLSYVSQFGKVDKQGLYQYIIDAELGIEDMQEFEIPEVNMEEFKEEYFDIAPNEVDLPDLSGTDPDCQQVTFILSNEQKDILDEALEKAKKTEECSDGINQNANGNALAAILKNYVHS